LLQDGRTHNQSLQEAVQQRDHNHQLNKEEVKMATAIWQGTEWHETQASTDQGQKNKTGPTTRGNEATQILELLTFSEKTEKQRKVGAAQNILEPQIYSKR
jgi:hypothetical protein